MEIFISPSPQKEMFYYEHSCKMSFPVKLWEEKNVKMSTAHLWNILLGILRVLLFVSLESIYNFQNDREFEALAG